MDRPQLFPLGGEDAPQCRERCPGNRNCDESRLESRSRLGVPGQSGPFGICRPRAGRDPASVTLPLTSPEGLEKLVDSTLELILCQRPLIHEQPKLQNALNDRASGTILANVLKYPREIGIDALLREK